MTNYDIHNWLYHIIMLKKGYGAFKHSPTIILVMSNCDINEGFCHNKIFIKDFVSFFNTPQGYIG